MRYFRKSAHVPIMNPAKNMPKDMRHPKIATFVIQGIIIIKGANKSVDISKSIHVLHNLYRDPPWVKGN